MGKMPPDMAMACDRHRSPRPAFRLPLTYLLVMKHDAEGSAAVCNAI